MHIDLFTAISLTIFVLSVWFISGLRGP